MKSKIGMSNMDVIRSYIRGDRPFVQIGYNPMAIKREVGDVWEDVRGITWEQRSGYKARVNKQANIIKAAIYKKCHCGLEIKWGNRFDKLFFAKTGMCQDCLVEYEHKLHITGIFNIYEKCKVLSNEIGFFKDAKAKLKETVQFFSKGDTSIEILCNSQGFREKFHGTNKEQILKDAKRDLTSVRRHLTKIIKEMKEARYEFKQKAAELKIETYV